MNELLNQLIEKAKGSKRNLRLLKTTAVKMQEFELASQLRGMEKELYPESEEDKEAKGKAAELSLAFRMVELNISDATCWLIAETIKVYNKKKGRFDTKDAATLTSKRKDLFPEDSNT